MLWYTSSSYDILNRIFPIKPILFLFQIDVWAAGVILYILLCGFPPFSSPDGDQEKLFDAILSARLEFPAPHWERVSAGAIDLVANMLRPQPELRFAAEDVLDHAWMAVSLLL